MENLVTNCLYNCLYICNIEIKVNNLVVKEEMMKKTVELVEFKLKEGVDVENFLQASESFFDEFLKKQPGLIKRNLIKENDVWGDLVLWNSVEESQAIEKEMTHSEYAGKYNSYIEHSNIKVKYFEVVH